MYERIILYGYSIGGYKDQKSQAALINILRYTFAGLEQKKERVRINLSVFKIL